MSTPTSVKVPRLHVKVKAAAQIATVLGVAEGLLNAYHVPLPAVALAAVNAILPLIAAYLRGENVTVSTSDPGTT